jgi:hypothetical protein
VSKGPEPKRSEKEKEKSEIREDVMLEMLKLIRDERLNSSPKREKEDGDEEGEKSGREYSETVKTGLEFQKLLGVEIPDAPLRCGDWLSPRGKKAKILSASGESYWQRMPSDAQDAYNRLVKATPMERLQVTVREE